jgi:hypothetical protein
MPFSIRTYRRFPVHCAVTCNAGSFQGKGTVAVSAGYGSAINRRVGCSHSITLVGVTT